MEWSVSWGLSVEAWNWGSVLRQTVDEVQLVPRLQQTENEMRMIPLLQQTENEVHLVWVLRLVVEAVLWETEV